MTAFDALLAALLSLPAVRDFHDHVIPRPLSAARVVARAALETERPEVFAVLLDVLAAHESAYRPSAVGDSGRSCGAFQTPCAETPQDALGQARVAIRILRLALGSCPDHVLWSYASGRCRSSAVALRYEADVRERMALMPSVAP